MSFSKQNTAQYSQINGLFFVNKTRETFIQLRVLPIPSFQPLFRRERRLVKRAPRPVALRPPEYTAQYNLFRNPFLRPFLLRKTIGNTNFFRFAGKRNVSTADVQGSSPIFRRPTPEKPTKTGILPL